MPKNDRRLAPASGVGRGPCSGPPSRRTGAWRPKTLCGPLARGVRGHRLCLPQGVHRIPGQAWLRLSFPANPRPQESQSQEALRPARGRNRL